MTPRRCSNEGEVQGAQLRKRFGDRVEFIHADVWDHLGCYETREEVRLFDYDTLFIDIWQGYGGNNDDPRFERLDEAATAAGKLALAWG